MRIVQIIDASGWLAVYDVGSGEVRQLLTRPLACWALVEEEGEAGGGAKTRVIGIDADQAATLAGGVRPESGRGGVAREPVFLGYAREADGLSRFLKAPPGGGGEA